MPLTAKQRRLHEFLGRLADRFRRGELLLLDVVHAVEQKHHYLPKEVLEEFCDLAHLPPSRVQAFVSSHSNLSMQRPRRVNVKICRDLPCHLAGSRTLLHAATANQTAQGPTEVSVVESHCMGFCDSAPVASINGCIHRNLTQGNLTQLIKTELNGRLVTKNSSQEKTNQLQQPSLAEYMADGGYAVYESLLRRGDPDSVIQRLEASGLRGFGGAGFKTGLKWRMVHEAKGSEKVVICNAEEGESGTFKDRKLLTQDPHSVLEGLFIAAWTVGASRAYVYLHQEYAEARRILNNCLKQLQRNRLTGMNIRGSGFNLCVRIVEAAGSYVSGEETALLESMEGNRCEPRLRPPYPATHGLHGKPTLIQNVETLSCIPQILKDNEAQLPNQAPKPRLKLYSVSGAVKQPGVYKLPLGSTARQLIHECAHGPSIGAGVKAFFPGGVSGGFLPASHMDVPLDFEALNKVGCSLGTGGVIVVDEKKCIVDVVENCLEFFARESCGKCTPCSLGTQRLLSILRTVKQGKAEPAHIALLRELGVAMNDASICGLGQTAYNPVRCALEFFEDEFLDHLHGRCLVGSCHAEAR